MAVQHGSNGNGTWIQLWNLVSMAVELGSNCCGTCFKWLWNLVSMAVEHGSNGCRTWFQWLWIMQGSNGRGTYIFNGCGTWIQWLWNILYSIAVELGSNGCGCKCGSNDYGICIQ